MIQIFVWKKSGSGAGVKRQLYVPADTSFNIIISNPLFSDFGTFSYPLTIPYEDNKHIFDFPGDGDSTKKSFSFELFQNYELFLQGDVEVVNALGIEIYLKAGKSSYTSILKSSFLDDKIGGHFWDEFRPADFVGSLNAIYPAFSFVAAPITTKDRLYNDYNFDDNSISSPCPATYVKHILIRIIEVFELDLAKDDLAEFSDFNRLSIWCAKNRITYFGDGDANMASWMPHISAFDLLKDLQSFGILLYFNPFLYQAELLLYKNIINAEPTDWSDKFVRSEHFDSLNPKRVKLSFKGEDDDILNPDQYDVPPARTVYGSLANLPDPNDFSTASPDEVDEIWLFQETAAHRRFFRRKSANPDRGPLYKQASIFDTDGLFLKTTTTTVGGVSYNEIDALAGQLGQEYSNQTFSSIQPNLINAYAFRVLEGELLRTMSLTTWIKSSSTTDAKLHIELRLLRDGEYTTIATHVENVKNTTYEYKSFYLRTAQPITLTGDDRLIMRLSCLSIFSRIITIASRREENDMDFFPFVRLDPDFYEWREVSALGALEAGFASSETEEIPVVGSIPINDLVQMGGGLFEIPVSSMDAKDVQPDFAYVIYRGKKKEVSYPNTKDGGYFNFDNRDIKSASFDTVASLPTPNVKLRWREEAGILEGALYDFVTHKAFKYREKRTVFKLKFTDLLNHKIYKPVRVDGVVSYIKSISIPVHMTRGIGDSTVDLISK